MSKFKVTREKDKADPSISASHTKTCHFKTHTLIPILKIKSQIYDYTSKLFFRICVIVQKCLNSPHSFTGSSDQSLQSFILSHTLLLSIHSPLLHMNFSGPSHLVAVKHTIKSSYTSDLRGVPHKTKLCRVQNMNCHYTKHISSDTR